MGNLSNFSIRRMTTVSELKRRLQLGVKMHTMHHMKLVGRDESGKPIYGDNDLGIREVSVRQTQRFALKTIKDGKVSDSWCDFPKASEVKFVDDDTFTIMETNDAGETYPVLTYKFIDDAKA